MNRLVPAHSSSAFFCVLSIARLALGANDAGKPIDAQRSSLTIHVGKAGLLSAAGHEHWIEAPIANGNVDDAGAMPSVRFVVEAAKLKVKAEKNLSAEDQAKVQFNMQSEVLESAKYPKIVFQSTRVQPTANGAWKVEGKLTLHGATRPITADVRKEKSAYVGDAKIKQTDFEIQPIAAGAGTVKVKNELEIRFEVHTSSR